jgi:hypothetical protein
MKKTLIIIGIIIAALIVLTVIKDQIVKSAVTIGTSQVAGAAVKIDGLSLVIFKQAVHIKGFKMYNPAGFPGGILVDLPTIGVDYDLPALLKGKLHLRQATIDLKELDVIKNKEGKLNVDSLKVVEEAQKSKGKAEEPAKQMPMQIDLLNLNIGKVVFQDFSKGEKPVVQVFDVQVKNKTFKNITNAQYLVVLVLTEAMKPTAIRGAAVYGAASVLGVAFLPAGIASMFIGKDSSEDNFKVDYDKAYNASLNTVRQMGQVTKENNATGFIEGKVSGCDVKLKIAKKSDGLVFVNVSARKYMMPKPDIAGGVLLEISNKLK